MEEKIDGQQEYINQAIHTILSKPLTLGSERRTLDLLEMIGVTKLDRLALGVKHA